MAEHNLDPQFRKDVLKAKAKYRKRRKFIIISVLSLLLVVTLVQTFFYIREKKQINAQLKEQSQQIEKLEKEAKVNDVVIDKLKDPQFITDLVRQEYGLSYGGEIIFSLPQQENFLNAIEAIMQGNIEKKDDGSGRIDDSKLPGSNKDSKDKKNKDDKSESKSEKTNEESSDEESENTSDKKTSSSNSNRNSTNTKKNSNTNNTQSNTRSNNRG